MKKSKRYVEALSKVEKGKLYTKEEAVNNSKALLWDVLIPIILLIIILKKSTLIIQWSIIIGPYTWIKYRDDE